MSKVQALRIGWTVKRQSGSHRTLSRAGWADFVFAFHEDLAGIRSAAERFLRALDDLDWEPFRASWASTPTAFFPFGDTPERLTGQVAVEGRWRRFFEEGRARTPGPPYLNLKPLDIRTERYGDVGLVTFTLELTVGGRQLPLQRRTLLFVREHDAWKLAHMHASGASQP